MRTQSDRICNLKDNAIVSVQSVELSEGAELRRDSANELIRVEGPVYNDEEYDQLNMNHQCEALSIV